MGIRFRNGVRKRDYELMIGIGLGLGLQVELELGFV